MFARLPLAALRTFESAARLASFKAAAEELSVTPTAVSHQIRSLENWLGQLLFERLGRGVRLTEAGERLYRSLHGALLDISHGLQAMRPAQQDNCVSLNTTPAFAALWLIPRLGRFYQRHPQIRVRIETSNDLVDLQRDASVDVAIRCGFEDFPELYLTPLMEEHFAAYTTPRLLAEMGDNGCALIGMTWGTPLQGLPDWQDWIDAAGEDWLASAPRRDYPDEHYALQAAISGQGLVLASSVLASDALASGLLQPYRADVRVRGARYRAVCVPGRERQPALRALLDWLQEEAG
ncbi:LysR substrate-binding domain-containing protein [Aquipseudomonas ullengensis]|uniref:LysR family transcriptional regulator n=1 Tax=Aquipseudomonas ullengensis TaxID=2759166 RepID=A0A7W4QDF5_9GAMM|nr:LysR substrate-binding domain-containing protein [Pseudomonas ullengensis]MBB2496006.1 LysR family transcriptional regulator [Pseudomonas ullengensis]